MLSWLPFSLKILNSEHFYGTVHLISHFVVSPWMAADAISGLPFFIWTGNISVTFQTLWTLHWPKPFTGNDDQMHMLRLCLAGLMDMFVILLSPSALYPGQMPQEPDLVHCQGSISFPSGARHDWGSHIPAVPPPCHAWAGLYPPVEWQSTSGCHPGPQQLQQVLPYVDRKPSVFQRSGALSFSQNIDEWPFEGPSDFWEHGGKVLKVDSNWCSKMLLLLPYSSFFDVQRGFFFQKVLK